MVILNMPSANAEVNLHETFNRHNHLVLEDQSIDKILAQIIKDINIEEEIDKID